jgi:protein tyrosine/serine phosphatase
VRAIALAVVALFVSSAAELPAVHVRNFDKVNDHVYRGGAPTAVGVQELGAMGVKTILDLREASEGTSSERELADKLKIKYINIPLGEFGAPSNANIQQILSLLQSTPDILFVHCRRGKDRTGTVIACYRIQYDGWDNRRALDEAKQHGMSSFERAMQSYILHFTPLKLPAVPTIGMPAPAVLR